MERLITLKAEYFDWREDLCELQHGKRGVDVVAALLEHSARREADRLIYGWPASPRETHLSSSELGIQAGDRVLGAVGSLYPVKGHKFLLDAMPTVLQYFPNTVLIIAGRGQREVLLKNEVKRLRFEEKVRFLGMRQDIPRLLALMDVFVFPSLSEGLSMALLEAMAAGKPVVATRVPSVPI